MDVKDIKFDCKYYKGEIPCVPNKLRGKICSDCDEYVAINKRILIIKIGAIGDVIRTTPLLFKIKEVYPNSHVTWITNYPDILPDDVDFAMKLGYNSILFVQNSTFDIAINLDKEKDACFLMKNAKAEQKYGFSWADKDHIIGLNREANDKILTGLFDNYSKSNTKSYQEEIFSICGFKFNNEPNLLKVDDNFSAKWGILKSKSEGKPVVGLNTGCGKRWITRRWPREYWSELIQLLKSSNFYPVLLGGEDEHDMNLKYSKDTGAFYPGYFSVREFIAIINNCDIIVTAVSMAMHIASGLQKPIVLFNNIFNKSEFELYGKGLILEPNSGCDCYYGSECVRKRHCMQDLFPDIVLSSVISLNQKI